MLALLLLSTAMGNAMPESFTCSDPSFSLMRDGDQATLMATVHTPQLGYAGVFHLSDPVGAVLPATLTLSQKAPATGGFGRGLTAIGEVNINERFTMPATVTTLHITLQGMGNPPKQVTCQMQMKG